MVILAVILVVLVVLPSPRKEHYNDACENKFNPDRGASLPYSVGQQYANTLACNDTYGPPVIATRARGERPVSRGDCPGGVCTNPIDFTGCSWYLPPTNQPDGVSVSDYTTAWANYYACNEHKDVGGHTVCRGDDPNKVCNSNNLNFSDYFMAGPKDWPGVLKIHNSNIMPTYDSNIGDQRWLQAVQNPDGFLQAITKEYNLPTSKWIGTR